MALRYAIESGKADATEQVYQYISEHTPKFDFVVLCVMESIIATHLAQAIAEDVSDKKSHRQRWQSLYEKLHQRVREIRGKEKPCL